MPVKTTSDLLVLRSDAYELEVDGQLTKIADPAPVVDLDDRYYKIIAEFDHRFPTGPPSLKDARYLGVKGEWSFEADVRIVGAVSLEDREEPQIIAAGSTLTDEAEPAAG